MQPLNKLIKDIERDLIIQITLSVKYKRIDLEQAKKIAREFVSIPKTNSEDLFNHLFRLSNSFRQVRKVYVKYAPEFYERKRILLLSTLRKQIDNELWKS